jgi:hypothetical protein
LARFEFESGIVLFYFSFFFVLFGESRLLVSWCAGGRYGMACSDEDHGRSRRLGAKDQGWSHRSGTQCPGGREVRWRRVRSAPGTWRPGARVSWLSLKTTRAVFAGLASKPVVTVFTGLASKPFATVFTGLASKPVATVFVNLASKLVATVFWFGP